MSGYKYDLDHVVVAPVAPPTSLLHKFMIEATDTSDFEQQGKAVDRLCGTRDNAINLAHELGELEACAQNGVVIDYDAEVWAELRRFISGVAVSCANLSDAVLSDGPYCLHRHGFVKSSRLDERGEASA